MLARTEKEGRTGFVILNRPEKRNALSTDMVTDLHLAFKELEEDEEVKVVVLRAEGKAFCAGADLGYLQQLQQNTLKENLEDSQYLRNLFFQIYKCSKPTIAQIEGHAIAGGSGLASVCDFVFAVPEAQFGFTEVRIGFIPALVSVFLLRRIGGGLAREMLLSGELYLADEMLNYGLVNFVVESEKIEDEVRQYAEMLASKNSGDAMSTTKQMIDDLQDLSLEEALDRAVRFNAEARSTADCQRGIAAFLNKEKIDW
ncbi:MAG: enoyl-CoA hydratase/isomerase family protein [Cyclobacteriaceae bacterium]|nr:enoyl-CoA hydratase/isomerase family protein [Cyclobacteriaceae bacterium HetDA_MAG_MS6]